MESYTGRWKIEGSEEIVIGELRGNEEKWTLCIESKLKRNLERLNDEIKFIEGRLLDGREVTILNANVNYLSFGSGRTTLAEYDCETVIIGKYFQKDDLKFDSINIQYSCLSLWILYLGIIDELKYNNNEISEIKFKAFPQIEINCENYKINILFNVKKKYHETKFGVDYDSYVRFDFANECYLDEVLEYANDFSNLLTILIGENIKIERIFLKEESLETNIFTNIIRKNNKEIRKRDILIRYIDIKDKFKYIIDNWIKKKEELRPVVNNFIRLGEDKFFDEVSFLRITQALEVYSRRFRYEFAKEIKEDDKSYNKKGEPRLKHRLKDLLRECDFLFDLLTDDNTDEIIKRICNTRNYYTHYDKKRTNELLNDTDSIFYIGKYLNYIVQILILMELGIDKSIIKDRFEKNNQFKYIKKAVKIIVDKM